MKKSCLLAALALPFALLPQNLRAQAAPAATRGGGILQLGITYTNSNQDEYLTRLQGMSIYSTFDLTDHLGVEANAHLPALISSQHGYTEQSYDAGLRYVYRVKNFQPYAKGLLGIGRAYAPSPTQVVGGGAPGTYFMYALGGGLDYQLTRKLNVRALDFEYQDWTGFPPNGLTPSMISVGIAYRLR